MAHVHGQSLTVFEDSLAALAELGEIARKQETEHKDCAMKERALTDYFADASLRADNAEDEVRRLTEALQEIGCLEEHYCSESPFAMDIGNPRPTCVRCAALAVSPPAQEPTG